MFSGCCTRKKPHIHPEPWIFFVWNCTFTFLRHFFRAADLKVPEIVRTNCLMLSDCYILAIKASVAHSCMALAHAETIFEGLLQVVGIKLIKFYTELSHSAWICTCREIDGTTDVLWELKGRGLVFMKPKGL